MTQQRGRQRNDRAAADGSAGAWAAAALVVGLGGLLFGVVAQLRTSSIEERLDLLEAEAGESQVVVQEEPSASTTTGPSSTSAAGRQPADITAARKGVVDAYSTVYDGSKPQPERLRLVDDPTDVGAAMTFASSGEVGQAYQRTRARVDDVTFTSAEDATVRYRVLLDGAPALEPRIGAAVLAGDTWKVTRATVCADLAEVGAPCDI
jgi:hypothetical protein